MSNDEWQTPGYLIEMARDVLGDIDLDPASSHAANERIRAKKCFTIDDGENTFKPWWHGNVWLNPPYSRGLINRFVDHLLSSYKNGFTDSYICLVNNCADTIWCQRLLKNSKAHCFLAGRVSFINPLDGKPSKGNRNGSVIFYAGGRALEFISVFGSIGYVNVNINGE